MQLALVGELVGDAGGCTCAERLAFGFDDVVDCGVVPVSSICFAAVAVVAIGVSECHPLYFIIGLRRWVLTKATMRG